MSTPRRHILPRPVQERATCMCAHGQTCSSFARGHALHLIQARLAAATPSDWIDVIVDHADATSGDIVVRTLDGAAIALWNGAGAAGTVTAGEPAALHARYDVLSIGAKRYNALRTP